MDSKKLSYELIVERGDVGALLYKAANNPEPGDVMAFGRAIYEAALAQQAQPECDHVYTHFLDCRICYPQPDMPTREPCPHFEKVYAENCGCEWAVGDDAVLALFAPKEAT